MQWAEKRSIAQNIAIFNHHLSWTVGVCSMCVCVRYAYACLCIAFCYSHNSIQFCICITYANSLSILPSFGRKLLNLHFSPIFYDIQFVLLCVRLYAHSRRRILTAVHCISVLFCFCCSRSYIDLFDFDIIAIASVQSQYGERRPNTVLFFVSVWFLFLFLFSIIGFTIVLIRWKQHS